MSTTFWPGSCRWISKFQLLAAEFGKWVSKITSPPTAEPSGIEAEGFCVGMTVGKAPVPKALLIVSKGNVV